ncbi:MAG: hypothetical protein A2730_01355 [Candidatus Staskawiczbacteria bacterium RIFCSPHIGHO2_01_FULL_39_25]|uniref:Polysaccharide biosynthesis protein CapD-like domain-containing protein n=1 Tax=Candidatus Staskawiczbacteria bacterium RIFCSPHIGHO2_01_FULL_39_25 TaxID=1802202 RepID=A0A1G2HNH0_9BACT|nr:MAG: hypothetical protein A2730_01355 [Candidatus Staskawiczbacteria bacterium RIFCSPHIGHO2_01_FULL_39_25]
MNLFKRTALTRTLFFVSSDIALIVISILLAFLMRFDGQIPPHYYQFIIRMAALAIIFTIPIFYFQRLYSFSWSYVSANEAISLFKASLISFLFLSIAIYISNYFPKFQNFPRSTIFISYILIFTLCGALRFSKKIYLHIRGSSRLMEKERTLIVGAGDAGEQILRNMLSSAKNNYYPVGFVDDSNIKQGVKIHGLKVLGKISDLPRIIVNSEIRQLIIALPSASNKVIKQAVELGRSAGLKKIKIAPPMNEIIRGEVSLKNLKDVGVEDLLGRDPVGLDKKQIENFIKDNVVLITGAAGSIGSELTRQVAKFRPSKLVLLDQDETGIFAIAKEMQDKFPMLQMPSLIADIRDKEKMDAVFKEFHPQIVFHAAAYKHVPLMELQPDEAVKNNVFGTEILADISAEHGVEKFIFISTDKAVNPTSVMGATKRAGEMICQEHNQAGGAKFISVRFGNVLNSRGSVIPIFREQIRKGGPVEVTDPEMKRYFMLTSEACLLVMQAGAMGQGGEVFVLDMGKPVKILDLAREMIKLSGFEPDKDIAIVFVGIRPGEKLFEEILTAEEGTVVTENQKIFMAKLSQINVGEFAEKLEKLKESAVKNNKEEIIKNLKDIIPSFANQTYEK